MNLPSVLNGRYELVELLGRGGMADVYHALDRRLGRTVAVKVLRADLARDAQLQARFKREAQAVAGLNHPSIVAVYDTDEHRIDAPSGAEAHIPYIVMELVHGRTLRDLIRAREVNVDHAIDYTLGVLSALEYSHRAGIVHRDIKPANVMVTEDAENRRGTVKVMDFGIARTLADSAATMTQTQTVMGTAQYLSPEQARGEVVDERSDLYSAACLFYEMLAGRPPFLGDSAVSVAYQHVRESPAPPSEFNPDVPAALDALILRALQKNRADRFQDAASFRRALRAARTGASPGSSDATVPEPVTDPVPVHVTPVPGFEQRPEIHGREIHGQDGWVSAAAASRGSGEPVLDGMDDGGPATRAMAKILAGGALTTDDSAEPVDPPENSRKRRRRAWLMTMFVFVALLVTGGAVFGYNLLTARPPQPVMVAVPTVASFSETDALTRITNANLKPVLTEDFNADVPKGSAIGTSPAAGALVAEHSEVELSISKGPATVTIPQSLVKETESQARQDLSALSLTPGDPVFVDDPVIARGLVVTTDPKPGQSVGSGTTVNLKISSGQVTMPTLFNMTEAEATKAVQAASPTLKVEFEEQENAVVAPGKVTRQSVSGGSKVDQGTTIAVQIAKAPPKPSPSPSPGPTATASPTPEVTTAPAPSPTPKKKP